MSLIPSRRQELRKRRADKKSAKIIDGDTVSFGNAVMKFTSNGYGVESEEAEDGKKVDFTNATRLVNLADNSAFYLNGTCL